MVKELDDNTSPWPDHIGWRLWQASHAWQRDFVAAMRDAGHDWMTDARATLLGCIGFNGTAQTQLIERMGVSKQAVQQLLDGLEKEGVLERLPSPDDKRARIVAYTGKGRHALEDANRVKLEIDSRYRARLGDDRYAALLSALGDLVADAPIGGNR